MIHGCVVFGNQCVDYADALTALGQHAGGQFDPLEIQRVSLWEGGGQNYELIRGGRWVDWWEAQYGAHKDESKEKIRCTS